MGDIRAFLEHLRMLPDYVGQIVHEELIPPRTAEYGDLDDTLPEALSGSLAQLGIERLYRHQAEAINTARAGQHVIISTGTASGKTLCYNIPMIEAALQDPLARGIYLFPTKALAQDQLRTLRELLSWPALSQIRVGTYDGDTTQGRRNQLRRTASILPTNPDMLQWVSFPIITTGPLSLGASDS